MENSGAVQGSRQSKLRKSFSRALRSLLSTCSEEEFRKAFPSFTAAEQNRLHGLFIQVIASVHENIEEEFESILLETQVGPILDSVEELVEEHKLDPLPSTKSNVGESMQSLSESKKIELQHLTGLLKKAEDRKNQITARLELLKNKKQDYSGAANLVDELRSGVLNYEASLNKRPVNLLMPSGAP